MPPFSVTVSPLRVVFSNLVSLQLRTANHYNNQFILSGSSSLWNILFTNWPVGPLHRQRSKVLRNILHHAPALHYIRPIQDGPQPSKRRRIPVNFFSDRKQGLILLTQKIALLLSISLVFWAKGCEKLLAWWPVSRRVGTYSLDSRELFGGCLRRLPTSPSHAYGSPLTSHSLLAGVSKCVSFGFLEQFLLIT